MTYRCPICNNPVERISFTRFVCEKCELLLVEYGNDNKLKIDNEGVKL